MSPGPRVRALIAAETDAGIEPRWTGKWAACAVEAPRGVEDGAGVVPPLLDVRREAGAAQRRSHFLGDRGEEALEDFERHGVHQGVLSTIMFARGP